MQYAYWRAKLAAPGERLPINETRPESGFYAARFSKSGDLFPVAFWYNSDDDWNASAGCLCQSVDGMIDADREITRLWLSAWSRPVRREVYMHRIQTGQWADAPDAISHPLPADDGNPQSANAGDTVSPVDVAAPAGIGHNAPPADEPIHVQFMRQLRAESDRVAAWLAVPDRGGKSACDTAANWKTDLLKLEKRVIAAFDAEKEPIRAQAQIVDEKWRDVKALASDIKARMQKAFDAMAREETARVQKIAHDKAVDEAKSRHAAEVAARAEQARAEREWRAANPAHHADVMEREPETAADPVMVPVIVDPVRMSFGTTTKLSARKLKPIATVIDYHAAARFLLDSGDAGIKEVIEKAARRIVAAGGKMDGVE